MFAGASKVVAATIEKFGIDGAETVANYVRGYAG
jgi:hypothetical protein